MSTIEERRDAGIAWLDEHRPGWREHADPDTLEMENPCGCILAQTTAGTGNYFTSLDDAGFDEDAYWDEGLRWAVDHGFATETLFEGDPLAWGTLTDAWREALS